MPFNISRDSAVLYSRTFPYFEDQRLDLSITKHQKKFKEKMLLGQYTCVIRSEGSSIIELDVQKTDIHNHESLSRWKDNSNSSHVMNATTAQILQELANGKPIFPETNRSFTPGFILRLWDSLQHSPIYRALQKFFSGNSSSNFEPKNPYEGSSKVDAPIDKNSVPLSQYPYHVKSLSDSHAIEQAAIAQCSEKTKAPFR